MNRYEQAANVIKRSNYLVALTGAGMSTDSGIPDFRSSTGLYKNDMPEDALSINVMKRDPERFYHEGFLMLKQLHDKEPNGGHFALTELQKMGYLNEIITQNIDNLHFKAGSDKILEVHGDSRGTHCMSCGYRSDLEEMIKQVDQGDIPPHCPKCDGIMRVDTVLFGDSMPQAFNQALIATEAADAMLVIGSSLRVMPVAYLPRNVDHLIIINEDRTPYDNMADVVFNENATHVLEEIIGYLNE